MALRARSEALHQALASAVRTAATSASGVKKWAARHHPTLIDRVSPVYDATLLMEVCKARGVGETTMVQVATALIEEMGASAAVPTTRAYRRSSSQRRAACRRW